MLAFDRASSLKLPLLLLHGGADKVASAEASRELFARVTDPRKELRVLDDQYHEIFNELDWDRWITSPSRRPRASALRPR